MQAKLDEILRSLDKAREEFVGIEHLTDNQIEAIRHALEADIRDAEGRELLAVPTVERLLNRY
ncbi:low affinity iron permease family protein [Sphingopyxis fribergensis]